MPARRSVGGCRRSAASTATAPKRPSSIATPAAYVRRPKIDYESHTLGLDRNELGAFLVQAGPCGGRDHALMCLLALNGLRISEALGAEIENDRHATYIVATFVAGASR